MDGQKLDWIRSQSHIGKSPAEIASILNTPVEIDNPVPQEKIPAPIDLEEARKLVPDAESFEVLETKTYDRILEANETGDRVAIANHIKALVAGGKMSPQTAVALSKLMSVTIPDPNYQARITVSPAAAAGFGPIYTSEVEEAIG